MTPRAWTNRGTRAVREHPWFVGWLTFLPVLFIRAGTMAESDTFWQIRTGVLTLSHHSLPRSDTYSWTAAGRPWRLNSWGFNVVVGVLDQMGGLAAAALGSEAIVAAALWIVLLLARRQGAHPLVATVTGHVGILLLFTFLSARPQVVDYLAVLVIVFLLDALLTGRGHPTRLVAGLGVVSLLWVNLHATAIMGVGLIGGVAVLAGILPHTRSRSRLCFVALLAAAAGALVNPYGIGVIQQSFQVANASTTSIVEWQPLDLSDPQQLLPLLVGVAGLVVAARRREPVYVGVLLATLVGAVLALRMLPFATLVALPLLASAASPALVADYIHSRRSMLAPAAAMLIALFVGLAVPVASHLGRPDPRTYSPALVAQLPHACHLFNTYAVGGYVILERPDVKVSIDSRNDMYGETIVDASDRAVRRPRAADLAGASCALVPSRTAVARWLGRHPEWHRIDSDTIAVLYVRR